MCGIAGFLSFRHRRAADPLRIERMLSVLRHRGPDDVGVHCDRGLAVGARRLSIVDLAGGRQPIVDADRQLALVCNGEIYNHLEIRRELESRYCFRTRCDSEVVLGLYAVYGHSALERLNGMFAFALWDQNEEQLWCARDRAGQKPFYYATHQDGFVFASEPAAILRHSPELRDIDRSAVGRYLVYDYVPTPDTIFRRIKRLPAGCSLLASASGSIEVRRYWRLTLGGPEGPPASGAEELRTVFDRAVARHVRADVPVGVFLSGGLDSSAVVGSLASQGLAGGLKTFSVAIPEPAFDESGYAALVARRFATDHETVELTARAFRDTALRLAQTVDEPLSDASIVGGALVASAAARRVKVVLGGDGGDELFAGYPSFIGQQIRHLPVMRRLLPRLAAPLARALGRLRASEAPYRWDRLLTLFLAGGDHPPEVAAQLWLGAFAPGDGILAHGEPLSRAILDDLRRCVEPRGTAAPCSPREAVDRTLRFYFDFYLQDDILTKIDRASMASSLEQRSPLLDDELVAFAARLDPSQKAHGLRTKILFREAMRGRVPPPILRRQKRGFSMPLASWFRGDLLDFLSDTLARPVVQRQGFFDPDHVQSLIDEHTTRRADHRRKLWSLLSFTLWHERFGHA
ncbi:MAG: asparagine synthase (glutamine-hydrolyzing) [Vicinamibacterales bacterium]